MSIDGPRASCIITHQGVDGEEGRVDTRPVGGIVVHYRSTRNEINWRKEGTNESDI